MRAKQCKRNRNMKKLIALLLVAVMMLPVVSAMAATEFDVTEPITIEW